MRSPHAAPHAPCFYNGNGWQWHMSSWCQRSPARLAVPWSGTARCNMLACCNTRRFIFRERCIEVCAIFIYIYINITVCVCVHLCIYVPIDLCISFRIYFSISLFIYFIYADVYMCITVNTLYQCTELHVNPSHRAIMKDKKNN